jgi:hypothetical protein
MKATNERKPQIKDPGKAWALLLEHGDLVFSRMRWFLSQAIGRPVEYVGDPFQGSWRTQGHLLGRQALDFVEEAEGGLLEAAAHTLETWDPEKGSINGLLNKVLAHAVVHELRLWQATSTDQPVDTNDGGESAVHILREGELGSAGVYDDALIGVELDEPDDEMTVLSLVLTKEECYAVERQGDGASQSEIAADLDQFFPLPAGAKRTRRQAQTVLERALRRMRKAVQQ